MWRAQNTATYARKARSSSASPCADLLPVRATTAHASRSLWQLPSVILKTLLPGVLCCSSALPATIFLVTWCGFCSCTFCVPCALYCVLCCVLLHFLLFNICVVMPALYIFIDRLWHYMHTPALWPGTAVPVCYRHGQTALCVVLARTWPAARTRTRTRHAHAHSQTALCNM